MLVEVILKRFGNESTSLAHKIDLSSLYADSTCVKLNIHHPVDWVLLRDAIKSIVRGIQTIRRHGLKHRINPPNNFIKEANRISIAMTMTKSLRRSDAKTKRKQLLRELKSLLRQVSAHGMRYLRLINDSWVKTYLSEAQAEQIAIKMIKVIDQVDDIIFQAHERIIGERQVKNKDKILSLYETHVQVYKRGKAGADVEFGLQLFIAETKQGLIANWQLRQDAPQGDNKFVTPCINRLKAAGIKPDNFTGDRGFVSKRVEQFLEKNKINSHICPRNGKILLEKMRQKEFREATTRRSQTEARISILKHNFIGSVLKAKGFENQERHVSWAILTHNLWVIAKMPMKENQSKLVA